MQNVKLYYFITFLTNCSFHLPIWVIFGTDYLELSNFQTMFLGTFGYFVSTLLDIPTGNMADRYGRKFIYIIGLVLNIIGISALVVSKDFYVLLLFMLINGIGIALISGSLEALIYDNLLDSKNETQYAKITSNSTAILYLGRSSSALLGGILFIADPTYPYTAYVITLITALILSLFLFDDKKYMNKDVSNSSYKILKNSLVNMLKDKGMLTFLSFLLVFVFIANILFVSFQPIMQNIGFDERIIGIVYIFISLASAVSSKQTEKAVKKFSTKTIALVMLLTVGAVSLLFLIEHEAAVLAGILLVSFIFGFQLPLTNIFANKRIKPELRTTSLSTLTFTESLAFILCSWVAGIILDKFNLETLMYLVFTGSMIASLIWMLGAKKAL